MKLDANILPLAILGIIAFITLLVILRRIFVNVGAREIAIGGNVTVGQFIEEMADPRGHHHRQPGGDHRQDDQARGDADDLLLD